MKKVVLSSLLAALLAACSSSPVKQAEPVKVEDKSPVQSTARSSTADTQAAGQSSANALSPLKDPNNILSKRSIYFDLDEYTVKDEFKPLVQAHAKYLSQNTSASLVVQGNTDERGSREYNLALGERRAAAVKKALTVSGASDNQIQTTSFGEEKPKCTEAEESCWSQNRRADIVYQGE